MNWWQCLSCGRHSLRIGERRGNEGYRAGICTTCSIAVADAFLADSPPAVAWLVDHLRAELATERNDRAEDARFAAQELRDELLNRRD